MASKRKEPESGRLSARFRAKKRRAATSDKNGKTATKQSASSGSTGVTGGQHTDRSRAKSQALAKGERSRSKPAAAARSSKSNAKVPSRGAQCPKSSKITAKAHSASASTGSGRKKEQRAAGAKCEMVTVGKTTVKTTSAASRRRGLDTLKNASAAVASKAKDSVCKTPGRKPGSKELAAQQAEPKVSVAVCEQKGGVYKPQRTHLESYEYDGEHFKVGDSAYLVALPDQFDWEATEEEQCHLCGKVDGGTMVECDQCLLGFHLTCLKPPLKDVPKGSWLCPTCCGGLPVKDKAPITAREKYFFGKGVIELVRIEALWKERDGQVKFVGRWYLRPEETCTGRQPHHSSREVFLSNNTDVNEIDFLLRPVAVVTPQKFSNLDDAGDDVFLCEYEYDMIFQNFRRHSEREHLGADADWDWDWDWDEEELDDSSDEDFDEGAERRGSRPKKGSKKGSSSTGTGASPVSRRKQGGELFKPGPAADTSTKRGKGRAKFPHIPNQPKMPLAMARASLALSARPRELPCRDCEKGKVQKFLVEFIQSGPSSSGHCLYISGVPGTGKTATCLEVARQLQQQVKSGSLSGFRFVEINGLRLPTPHHAYSRLYEALTGRQVVPATALELLEESFSKGKCQGPQLKTVVLLDEMDLMVTRKQTVLYNFFNWPMCASSNLAVIGVANTMDLPERLLPRIASRLGQRRVQFMPYNQHQIKEIIESRLKDIPALQDLETGSSKTPFHEHAIQFVSRKVASVSGDCRRALEICRRAAEIAEAQQRRRAEEEGNNSGCPAPQSGASATTGLVRMPHVDQAVREMFNSTHVQLMRSLSRTDKLLLAMIHLEAHFTGRVECRLLDVANRLEISVSNAPSQKVPQVSQMISTASRLGALRMIICDPGAARWEMRLALNVPSEDIVYVLKSDDSFKWLHGIL